MSDTIDNLQAALQHALAGRPAVGGVGGPDVFRESEVPGVVVTKNPAKESSPF